MAERMMEELLRAPTEGYGESIVLPEINADHFEIKTKLLQLVQANPFYSRESENPHAHINSFKRITSTLRLMNATSSKTDERIDKLADLTFALLKIVSKKVHNIVSVCATTGTYNQVNPPNRVSNQMAPPGLLRLQNNGQNRYAQSPPPVIPISNPEFDIPKSSPKPNIPYPSRRDDQKSRDKASNQMEKIFKIFQDLRFDISFADAFLLMPRFAPTIKSLLMNKEKLLELAKIPLNENCSAMLLKKLPEKLGDPGKFLIPCNFPGNGCMPRLGRSWREHKSYVTFYLEKVFSARTYTNSDDFRCMHTRNSNFPNNSNVTILRRRIKGRVPNIVEPELRTIVAPMAERTMEELLRAPTEAYGEAIVLPEINADHFEIKTNLNVPNDVIKLMMFPYSLEGAAKTWYEKEPQNSILTWEDLVTKFVNQFFPPSKTTHLKNEISQFTQKFEETFSEAWERFKELL
ncbi:reverse transcriptase domain-containing protein [Tanacetum coccineum]